MGQFVIGDVVVVNFPFSDMSVAKRRPALILATAEFDDLILCQITSKPYTSKRAVRINHGDFKDGELPRISYARPDKLFTAESAVIEKAVGKLSGKIMSEILVKVRRLFIV